MPPGGGPPRDGVKPPGALLPGGPLMPPPGDRPCRLAAARPRRREAARALLPGGPPMPPPGSHAAGRTAHAAAWTARAAAWTAHAAWTGRTPVGGRLRLDEPHGEAMSKASLMRPRLSPPLESAAEAAAFDSASPMAENGFFSLLESADGVPYGADGEPREDTKPPGAFLPAV